MKPSQIANYIAVLLLTVAAAGLYFAPEQATTTTAVNQITLPQLISLNLNQQVFLTKTYEYSEFNEIAENIVREQHIDFKARLSPVYSGLSSNYLMTFIETKKADSEKSDIQFVMFKKFQDHYRIVITLKVTDVQDSSIKLSYGSIDFLDQDQFNSNALKLAQTLELENNF